MQKIYRCPTCTKASYNYGFCSEICEKEFPKKIEEETKNNLSYKLDGVFNTDDIIHARIADPIVPTIHFKGTDNIEILRLEPNGDIYIHGELAENDKQVTDGLRNFLLGHGY